MRINEFITELRVKKVAEPKAGDTTVHDYNPGWETLNWLKEQAARDGNRLAQRGYQLFMPRANAAAQTPRDRRLANLANNYAWDEQDPTQLKPQYAAREQPRKELSPIGADEVSEAAPILKPGKATSPPGRNKPSADLWTSTAIRGGDGTYTSDWVRWVHGNQHDWMAPTGFLYKVKPGALILTIDSDHDAERIYHAFEGLGTAQPIDYSSSYGRLTRAFPWDQVVKHFDGVHHSGYRSDGDFTYGWDCESTAWFDTSFLIKVAEVPISPYTEEEY